LSKLQIKVEGDEFDALCRDLVDLAIEAKPEDCRVLLRILQLLLYGEWEEFWILSRWEGDFELLLGAYSSRDKAISAAEKNRASSDVEYAVEYHLFHVDLDHEPNEELPYETITLRKQK